MEIPDHGKRVRRLLAGLALVAIAASQEAPEILFRSTTKLVEITVIARDKHDQPVADLKQDEFEVLDNGRPQAIRLFVTDTKRKSPPPPLPGVFSNRTLIAPGERSGYTLVVLDALNTGFGAQAFARQQALKMLRTLPPGEKVALYVLGRAVRVVHEFTPDTAALARRLSPERGEASSAVGSGATDPYSARYGSITSASLGESPLRGRGASKKEKAFMLDNQVRETVEAFEWIAKHLEGIPGQKTLLWVTAGFPANPPFNDNYKHLVDRVTRRLANANVAVHAVDARGLIPGDPWPNVGAMMLFADQTGGRVYYNRNDIDVAMREAIDSLDVSYSLGYYQPEDGVATGDHKITVKVRRPDVKLHYRQSYNVEPPLTASPPKLSATTKPAPTVIDKALSEVADASAIRLQAAVDRQGESLALRLHIEPGSMTFEQKDGRWQGALEVLSRFTMADGRQAGDVISKGIKAALLPSTHEKIMREGMKYGATLRIPPQAATLRVVVRDPGSGQTGSLTIPLGQVPFAKTQETRQ